MDGGDGGSDRQLTRSERQMAYARAKRDEGKCGYSGCHEPSPAKFYCPKHAEAIKAQRATRKAADGESEAA